MQVLGLTVKLPVELRDAMRVQLVTLSEEVNFGPRFLRLSEVMYPLERAN